LLHHLVVLFNRQLTEKCGLLKRWCKSFRH